MIYLLNPPGLTFHSRSSRWGGRKNRSGIVAPPIYLAIATNFLLENGLHAKIIDAAALNLNQEELIQVLKSDKVNIIIIESATQSIKRDAEFALCLKKRLGCKIIMVGSHVTAFPVETMKDFDIDFICVGEYELSLLNLCRAILNDEDVSQIKGVAYRKGDEIIANPREELIGLDKLPYPAYEQLPINRYYDPIASKRPYMALVTSRGCPYKCTFCIHPRLFYNYSVRYRDPIKVIDEIILLKNKYGIKEILFDDATFALNKKHVYTLCKHLITNDIGVVWSAFGRCDLVDKQLIMTMKKAGCYMIRYGLESIDDNILKNIKKGYDFKDIKRALNLTKECGLKIHVTVMFGYPNETKETINNTLKFIVNEKINFAQFSFVTPYPGTVMHEELKIKGLITSFNWEDYDGTCNSVIKNKNLTQDELYRYIDGAYRQFYFRPSYILNKLFSIRSLDTLYYNFKSGLNLIKSQVNQ